MSYFWLSVKIKAEVFKTARAVPASEDITFLPLTNRLLISSVYPLK